jgi:hypothetical protein
MPNRDARGDLIHMGRQHVRDGFIPHTPDDAIICSVDAAIQLT